eukprot:scpid87845/ scgid4099/ 
MPGTLSRPQASTEEETRSRIMEHFAKAKSKQRKITVGLILLGAGALAAGVAFSILVPVHGFASLIAKLTGWGLSKTHLGWLGSHVISFSVGLALSGVDPVPSPYRPFKEICNTLMDKGEDVFVSCVMPPNDAASMIHLLINKDKMTSSSPSRGLSLHARALSMTFPASGSSKSMFKLLKPSGGYYGDSDDEGACASSAVARRM